MSEPIKDAMGVLLNIEDGLAIIEDILENENPVMFALLMRDVLTYGKTRQVPEMPRERRLYFRTLIKDVARGLQSMDESSINAHYAAYCAVKKRENKAAGKDEMDGILTAPEWWAVQDEYTPELFRNKPWYNEAVSLHRAYRPLPPDTDRYQAVPDATKYNINDKDKDNNNDKGNTNVNPLSISSNRPPTDRAESDGEISEEDKAIYRGIFDTLKKMDAITLVRENKLPALQGIMNHYGLPSNAAEAFRAEADLQESDQDIAIHLSKYIFERRTKQ